jgi:hypothetical protein
VKNTIIPAAITLAVLGVLASCQRPADVASYNMSYAADRFEINRRIVFFNGITDKYLMTVEGRCALGNKDAARELSIICMTGPGTYKKHFLGLSDNVSYFAEQLDNVDVSTFQYKVVFRPQTIVPDISVEVGR